MQIRILAENRHPLPEVLALAECGTIFGMFRRMFLVISLALLFGLGQQGAAVHAISHLADTQQRESQQDQKSHHLSFCDQCAAYAALDSAIDGEVAHAAFLSTASSIFMAGASRHPASHARYYAARAPPALA